MSRRLEERRHENQRLIAELEERVEQKTREVLRADRLATLGGIAAGFAHEIGNSLNVIRGYASVAERELPADHANREDVMAIRRETGRAAAMLERFLVFAGPATPRPTPSRSSRSCARRSRWWARRGPGRVTRHVEIAGPLPLVVADAGLLRQAFLNSASTRSTPWPPPAGARSPPRPASRASRW